MTVESSTEADVKRELLRLALHNAGRSVLHLGAGSNVLNVNTILLGDGKSGGAIDFPAAATAGTLTVTGAPGGASAANLQIGSSSSGTGSADESQLFLAGHNASVQAGTASQVPPRSVMAFEGSS